MIPFFSIDENWSAAESVIDSWIGTPYRHLWMKKKRGVDCALFIGAILQELGIIKEVEHDFYPKQWFIHSSIEIVKAVFERNIANQLTAGFVLKEYDSKKFRNSNEFMRGDILGFSTVPATGITNHISMLLHPPKNMIHCIFSRGVSSMQFGNFWENKITMIYRVEIER